MDEKLNTAIPIPEDAQQWYIIYCYKRKEYRRKQGNCYDDIYHTVGAKLLSEFKTVY